MASATHPPRKGSRLGRIARRTLLVGTAAIAGSLAVGAYFYRRDYPNPLAGRLADGEVTFNPYIKIAPDDTITVVVPRAEMGQGVTTTLAALVAEELDVGLADIVIVHGPASPAYFNHALLAEGAPYPAFDRGFAAEGARAAMGVVSKFLALQVTGGSTATVDAFEKMRHAGCAAREVLKAAAAERFGVAASALETRDGKAFDPAGGRSATYGELAAAAAGLTPPAAMTLRSRAEWRLLGKPQPRIDMRAKVTGAPIFGVDVELPGLLHATVRMNPRLGGALERLRRSRANGMRGVVGIVPLETHLGNGFGVIADNTWRAFRAADAVEAEWGPPAYPPDSGAISARLREALNGGGTFALREAGDVDSRFADAPRDEIVEAEYEAPFLAHATMEPMNATAWARDGRLDIWAPNQAPTILKEVCADVAGIDRDRVEVHTTYLGGGFGRRAEVDFAVYATKLAMEADGRPVKATWSREEDITHDAYRPAAIGRYRARVDADGNLGALQATVAAPSVSASVLARAYPSLPAPGNDKSIIDGAWDQPYAIPDWRVDAATADLAVPVGFWRSVGNSFNPFMQECFLDEVAERTARDPLALRLELARDWPAATGVLEKAAAMAGWGKPLPEGRARGIAFTLSFGTWVAQVVEVGDEGGKVRIDRVWCAADPGEVLDPGIFEAQMMSGIVFGLSSAVGEEITFAGGRVEQSNFHDYTPMRIDRCPSIIEVAILENSPHMGGAGEPGVPPAIPALANAVCALTGKRIRRLPLSRAVNFA